MAPIVRYRTITSCYRPRAPVRCRTSLAGASAPAAESPRHQDQALPPNAHTGGAMRSVDIPVHESDLVDTLSSMRVWLDHNHSKNAARGFRSTKNAAGVVTLH